MRPRAAALREPRFLRVSWTLVRSGPEPALREARILRCSRRQFILTRKIRVSRDPCFTSQFALARRSVLRETRVLRVEIEDPEQVRQTLLKRVQVEMLSILQLI